MHDPHGNAHPPGPFMGYPWGLLKIRPGGTWIQDSQHGAKAPALAQWLKE